jgi:hypothetical protein
MDQENEDWVFYDGRLMPLSQALAFSLEDVKRRQDFLKEHPEQGIEVSKKPGTDWDHRSLDQQFKVFWPEADEVESKSDAERQRLAPWGLSGPIDMSNLPDGAFTFDQFLPETRFTRKAWFVKLLRAGGYPEDLLAKQVITRAGYEAAVAKAQSDTTTRKTQNTRTRRSKRKLPANQVPEPNKRQRTKK